MLTDSELLRQKEKENIGLNRQITALKEACIRKDQENTKLKERAKKAEDLLQPIQKSLNRMTSENSRYIRKLKRTGVFK